MSTAWRSLLDGPARPPTRLGPIPTSRASPRPRSTRTSDGFDEETAALEPEDQARLAGVAIEAAGDFELYGYFTSGVTEIALASSTGLAADQALTDANALCLAAVDGASGWAEQTRAGESRTSIRPRLPRRRRPRRARTRGAVEIEPGHYRRSARALRRRGAAALVLVRLARRARASSRSAATSAAGSASRSSTRRSRSPTTGSTERTCRRASTSRGRRSSGWRCRGRGRP